MTLERLQKEIEMQNLPPMEASYCIDTYFSQGYRVASRLVRDLKQRRLKRRLRQVIKIVKRTGE